MNLSTVTSASQTAGFSSPRVSAQLLVRVGGDSVRTTGSLIDCCRQRDAARSWAAVNPG